MPKPAPAFSFYPKDWLADAHVLAMSLAERGAYITMLALCWHEGSLPGDEKELRRLVLRRGDRLVTLHVARRCFRRCTCGAKYFHPRLLADRRKQLARSEKARASAMRRHHPEPCERTANAQRSQCFPSPFAYNYAYMHGSKDRAGLPDSNGAGGVTPAPGVERSGAWGVLVTKADLDEPIATAVLSRYHARHGSFPTERRAADALQEGKDRGLGGDDLKRWVVAAINRGPKPGVSS